MTEHAIAGASAFTTIICKTNQSNETHLNITTNWLTKKTLRKFGKMENSAEERQWLISNKKVCSLYYLLNIVR